MLALSAQSRVFVAIEPIDFRKGIDSLGGVCRRELDRNPLDGAVYVFRNRRANAIKVLVYDGQGFWCCTKRLSTGRFQWWPSDASAAVGFSARELSILLWNGRPDQAQIAPDWRAVA